MGFADFLRQIAQGQPQGGQSQPVGGFAAPLVQRLAQQAVDAQHPTFLGHDVGDVPVLSGVLRPAIEAANDAGVINEGAGNVAKTVMGASTAELGALHELLNGPAGGVVSAVAQTTPYAGVVNALQLMDHLGPHLGPANPLPALAAAHQAASQPGNPFARAQAAGEAAQATSPVQTGLGEMAINPLNFAGGAGEAGAGLRAAEDAPAAIRALGAALEGASAVGRAGILPYEAGFGALGGLFGKLRQALPSASEAGQQFARQNAGNTALGAVRGNTPLADLLADVGADGKKGLGPALPPELGPELPPELGPPAGGRGNVPAPDLLPGLGINGRPGLGPELPPLAGVPLPPEAGPAFPEQGNLPKDQLLPGIGRNGGRGIGPLLPASQDLPVPPAAPAVQSLADLLGAARTTAQPTPLERLAGAAQATAAREVAPRQTLAQIEAAIPKLPTTPEVGQLPLPETGAASTPVTPEPPALDFTDRAGVVKAVANAPLDHLNNVLRDLHNAVYPGQQSDFAIPALTGQAKQEFRTSFLTDHPGGNAAEPYLDYLISRVQKDPKAAARLADLNPLLADDVNLLAESDLPLAEHKRLVQSLFGAGPFAGAETPPTDLPALSGQPGAQAGTLDDLRALITGGDGGKMGGYAPSDPAFYQKRLGIAPADVPGMLDQLVQEGTLGRLPDGSLGIKPAPPAGMTPAERADWQAKYVGQSQAGTDILAAGDKVGGSDLTQADLNALSPQERMAALRKLAGGFADAAGGGGFGLLPMSTGRMVGGLGGTLVGGGLGFAAGGPGTSLDDRLKRAGTGALLGGTLGTGLGSTAQGEALATEALAGNKAAWEAGDKTIIPTSIGKGVSSLRATSKTALMTIPRNITDNALKQWMGGNNPLRYLGDLLSQSREWGTVLPALRQAGDEQQRMHVLLTSLGPDFANRDPESMARLAVKQGMDYNLDPTDLGTAGAYPPVSAARGAVAALAQPVKLAATGYLTPAVGALEGLTLAGRAALQNAVLTPADMIGRLAFSMPVYTRELASAAPAFIRKVAASGQSTALLDQEGRFGASLIKDPTLRGEWEAIQNAAEDAGAQRALDYMGDFGTHSAARKITNNAAPGGVWNIGQSQLLARRAAEHPALATGAIGAAYQNYQSALAAGHPEEAGTATIDDRTPGVGLLARLANGGAPGTLAIPLTYSGSPIGPEAFDLPRQLDPFLHPNQQLYDKIKTIVDTAGLGVNPALDMAAYRLGISDTPHGSASRWAPIGTYAEQMAHAAGIPILGDLAENPVADLLDPAAKPGDVQQQLRTGRYLNPAAITAGNEMVYERRGTSASDPKNVDLVAQLRDPSSAFYQEALARGLGAKAGGALLGEVIPGHPEATTATARAEEAAKLAFLNQGFPLTSAQVKAIAAAPNGGQILSQLRQAQIDQAKLDNPALAVQDLATPQALGQKVFEQWQRDHAGLALFPSVYGVQGAQEQERLGLAPLGTAAAAQQHLDQLLSGQAYGRPELYPGVAPLPYDPTPILDLMRYLNGGR